MSNVAHDYRELGDLETAESFILQALELEKEKPSEDRLFNAVLIFQKAEKPQETSKYIEELSKISPSKSMLASLASDG